LGQLLCNKLPIISRQQTHDIKQWSGLGRIIYDCRTHKLQETLHKSIVISYQQPSHSMVKQ